MNLKELSESLGLSQTTVSRALNGYPEVNETTRARVEAAAKRYSYVPNTRAKGLATGRSNAIGHVIPISNKHEMVNPVFGDFIAGAGETYSRNGYEMVLSVVDDVAEEKTYRELQSRGTIDGLIVHGPVLNDPRIPFLNEIGLPFVVHGRASGITAPYSWLDVNNKSAFERATSFLLDLGHRQIALINGLENMDFAHRRRAGFEAALRGRDISIDPLLMRSDEMTETLGHRSARDMLEQPDPPTAFVVSSMICALGVRRAVEEMGLTLARDVSLITFDDDLSYLRNGDALPIFTATRSSVREAGRRCAEMLLAKIADPDAEPTHQLLEAELMVGRSTGPASASGSSR
ncbi:substrate-binding domain-containing protein [Thalassobium sp. R2A62]|jgi:LacI family transcriptional regulator|uniref:substrate-binding domain-containing protein n=1 Tax=Thalassobium sp. R2A62 TaxID=633131 RepID=UPI0001B1CB9B|nr:substrate-binding domain-containing protein [Thalassobium sp. R2A62]EET48303.1 transcriptional regulator, LacI family [Thalassobium sp. R2A62]MDG1339826.1 substrate-binding domain-containing protein [Paracoccaceae bacterium]MDG2452193.1 substrate-binding domain-containing protein [Paracoccaceae bacterium]